MQKSPHVYLLDIVQSIQHIEQYVNDMDYDAFEENIVIQDAVMRRFEIIGEATARLNDDFKQKHAHIPWRQMTGLRNIIIHDYSSVNLVEMWDIVTNHLTNTKRQIQQLL